MVLHPILTLPTVHLIYRYFEAGPVWWFGGGGYLIHFAEDAAHFHSRSKQACDPHHQSIIQCLNAGDEYFISNIARKCEAWAGSFDYQDGQDQVYRGPHLESRRRI